MSDIVERLRQHEWGGSKPSIFSDAADEIERLQGLLAEHPTTQLKVLWAAEDIEHMRAENERLRAALKYVASLPGADPLTGQLAVRAARDALKGQP
jgi:hypothetical protein